MLLFDCVVTGILKGYDQLLNLVLDGTTEYLRGKHLVNCWIEVNLTYSALHYTDSICWCTCRSWRCIQVDGRHETLGPGCMPRHICCTHLSCGGHGGHSQSLRTAGLVPYSQCYNLCPIGYINHILRVIFGNFWLFVDKRNCNVVVASNWLRIAS